MKCPHCQTGICYEPKGQAVHRLPTDSQTGVELTHGFCPECDHLIVILKHGQFRWIEDCGELVEVVREEILYPKFSIRIPDVSVPDQYRVAFNEANAVMSVSPKASAALSRRILQGLLHTEYAIQRRNLDLEIAEFIARKDIPRDIADAVDAIRNIGNFAAHPLKYEHTGEIVDVEVGEAEWLLDVLEALFDFTFIEPSRLQTRKDKLNAKLSALGKPPMKSVVAPTQETSNV